MAEKVKELNLLLFCLLIKIADMQERKLILIAEDDPDDRFMIHEAFQENNIKDEVIFFDNGEELHKYLIKPDDEAGNKKPSLIMLDLNMPRMDGKTVLKKIRDCSHLNHIPVVILTTSKSLEDRKNVIRLGGADFYTKPSSFKELVNITAAILSKWINTDFSIRKTEL